MAVRWSDEAISDLEDIGNFYATRLDLKTIRRLLANIQGDIQKLAVTPLVGRKDERIGPDEPGQYEYWYAYRSEYRVYYRRLGPRTIEVYRIWPSRKPPLEPDQIIPKS